MDDEERAWIEARIAKTRTLIERFEDAMSSLAGGAQSYSLDTGQTRQMVTKADVSSLRIALDELENRLAVLKERLNSSTIRVYPGF